MPDLFPPATSPMKIAVIAHTHPSISKGGAEISAYTLYKGLLSLGIDAIFIAACAEENRSRVVLGSAREHVVYYDTYDHFYHLAPAEIGNQLRAILVAQKITVASFHHFFIFGANTLRSVVEKLGIKVVLTLHEFLAICHHHGQMVTRPERRLCDEATPSRCAACFPELSAPKFALRRDFLLRELGVLDTFVSPSHFLADRVATWGLPRERISVIENGLVDVRKLAVKASKRMAGAPWKFGYFGQINPFKGLDTLLRAVRLIAQSPELAGRIRIRVHGNMVSQSEEFLKEFQAIQEAHPFVSYLGPYDNSQVGSLMADCDYVVVPSSWWENSPVVIQEAYAAGRPVVCSNIGGMAEKVRPGITGLHYAVTDHADLARVLAAAADERLYAKLRAGLPPVIDASEMARQYLDVFNTKRAGETRRKPKGRVRPVAATGSSARR